MRDPFDLDPKMEAKSIKNRFQNESEISLRFQIDFESIFESREP